MMKKILIVPALATALLLTCTSVFAADEAQVQERTQTQIYAFKMMTKQERNEHRARMQNAKTEKERARIRKEYHERMKERAEKRGYTLPDKPPAKGGGMGSGGGGGRR